MKYWFVNNGSVNVIFGMSSNGFVIILVIGHVFVSVRVCMRACVYACVCVVRVNHSFLAQNEIRILSVYRHITLTVTILIFFLI